MSRLWILVSCILMCLAGPDWTQDVNLTTPKVLFALEPGVEKRLAPTSDKVVVSRPKDPQSRVLLVNIPPGIEDYPGVNIHPDGASWDLSAYGHVEARVTNTGAKPVRIFLRVDNAGDSKDNPWNTESAELDPGKQATITTIFGFSYGKQPGFKLKPDAIVNILLFVTKSEEPQSFNIESVTAAGPRGERPPVAPEDMRVQPVDGFLLGPSTKIDAAKQVNMEGAEASLVGVAVRPPMRVLFPKAALSQSILLKPEIGRWDLRQFLELKVNVRNGGDVPVVPRARLETNGGFTDWAASSTPLAVGASETLSIPFNGLTTVTVGKKGSGSQITSDAVSGVRIEAENSDTSRVLYVDSIQAVMPTNRACAGMARQLASCPRQLGEDA